MRFYKLLLVVPMIAFGFAMDVNAGSCTLYHVPSGQGRGNGRLLYLSSGAYEKVTKDGCTNMFGTSDCVGDAMVCGDDTLGVATSVGGSGCNAGSKVIVDGGDSQQMGDITVAAGLSVYSCDGRGGSKADWTRSTSLESFSNSNCADASNFKKGDRYEEFFTKGDRVYYCIYSRYKTSNNNHACVASYSGAFCYMTKNQSSCYAKKLDYDRQNDTCKCKNKDEIYRDGKCIDDPVKKEGDCLARHGIYQENGNCRCRDNWVWNDKGQCVPSSQCQGPCVIEINLDNIGNISNSGNSSNTNENHNNSHNTNGGADTNPVENKACTPGTKEDMPNCDFYHNLRDSNGKFYDITGALQCAKECRSDGSGWMHYIKLCDAAKGYNCQQYGDGVGCEKCTKGRSGGGSGGSGSSCRADSRRTTPELRACCNLKSSEANPDWSAKTCKCVDSTKEFKVLDGEIGACVAKTDSPAATTPCNCTAAVTVVNTVTSNTCAAASSLVQSSVTNVNMLCPNGQPSASCNSDTLNAYVTTINMAITDCNAQPATPAKPVIDEKRLAAAVEAIDKYRSGLDVSVWKDEEGNFNTARLVSDSIAGVVLGTAGGLITSSVVKKNQVKSGFEDIMCTIGGQPVGSYGDEIQVGIQ